MTLTAIAAFLGLAVLDSLNPATLAALAFLMMGPRPLARGGAFMIATFVIYLLAGIALLEGWLLALAALAPYFTPMITGAAIILAGAGCMGFGVWLWLQPAATYSPSQSLSSLGAVIVFAAVSTLSDVPTAIPYFAAAAQLSGAALSWSAALLFLLVYNLIYVAPLLAMLAMAYWFADRAEPVLAWFRAAIDWSFQHIMPPALVIGGFILAGAGVWRIATSS